MDGTNLVRLNEQPIAGGGLIWSPDGKLIVYQEVDTIHVINPVGLKLAEIDLPYQPLDAQWLPDQSVLVFLMDDGVVSETCPHSLLLSFYWLDLVCLETTGGCTFEDAIRVPISQATAGTDFDIFKPS
jgi:hypothetical protein